MEFLDIFLLQYMSSYYLQVLAFIGIFTILAISLDIINGYAGQFSIGHAGFMAVGAYVSAYLTYFYNLNFFLATAAGAIAAGFFGLIIGLPTLRLRGDYLAIATLGFAEIIRVILLNIEVIGGPRGFAGLQQASTFTVVFIVTLICFILLYNFTRSRFGRSLAAIREDEIAAGCVGVPATYFKVLAFVLAASFAGVAGSLYAHYLMFLHPSDFGLLRSIEILLMIVLGGMGNLFGAMFGAIVLSILPEALRSPENVIITLFIIYILGILITFREGKKNPFKYSIFTASVLALLVIGYVLGKDILTTAAAQMRMIIYSILLVIMMIFRPQGLLGTVKFRLPYLGKKHDRVT